MYWNEDETLVLCPYNRYHVVSKLKIQRHILKCRKNYPNVTLVTCFYNFTHKLRPEDILKHYEVCSHKTRIEGARYEEENSVDFPGFNNAHGFNFPPTTVKTHSNCNDSCRFSINCVGNSIEYKKTREGQVIESVSEDSPSDTDLEKNTFCKSSNDDDNKENLSLVDSVFDGVKEKEHVTATRRPPSFQEKGFGRAKNIFNYAPAKPPRKTDHLLPDVSDMDPILPKKSNVSKFFARSINTSCSTSLVSSMFDDSTSLMSQSIIFDDDFGFDQEEKDENIDQAGNVYAIENNGFILKNFDKYVKI